MNLDFEEKELEDAPESLNNTLMNDLKCSSSESSISDYYIDEDAPCTQGKWEQVLIKQITYVFSSNINY